MNVIQAGRPHSARKLDMVPIFRLRLYNGGSIGPAILKRLWALALGSEDVGVARDSHTNGGAASYLVSATSMPIDLISVETRLRHLLQERLSAAHIQLTRLS